MSTSDLAERLDAVERALTDGDADLTDLRDAATVAEDIARLEERVADLETTVEELDAAVEAVRGYAGNVRAVNRDVERRASAALAKAEALEETVETRPTTGTAGNTDARSVDGAPGAPSRHRGSRQSGSTTGERPGRDEHGSRGRTDGKSGDRAESGTEQFIERVRDAL